MKANKIILIGCGMVGATFIYAAMIQNLAHNYVLIDINNDLVTGTVLDLEDINANLPKPFQQVKKGTYDDCKNADIIVITAGRHQLPGESRLALLKDNSLIMKDIAQNIKKSGFKGIIIVASNPVDLLTLIIQKELGFDYARIIGSGTLLDNARMQVSLSKAFQVKVSDVKSYIIGSHGDRAVIVDSHIMIKKTKLIKLFNEQDICHKLKSIHEAVINKADLIINKKQATFYGIAIALCKIIKSIINDEKQELTVSVYLNNEYGQTGLYTSVPAIIGKNGIEKINILALNQIEQAKFQVSCNALLKIIKSL